MIGSGKKKHKKKKNIEKNSKTKKYSRTRKEHRALKRSERKIILKNRYNLSDSSEFKSVSQKLDEHLSAAEFKSASEKYSEKGLRVKSMEENNQKLIERVISFKKGIYSPNILNKSEFEHILTTNDINDYNSGAPLKMSHIAYIYLSLKYPNICIPDKKIDKHGFIHSYVDGQEGGLYWCQNVSESGLGPGPESEPSSINSSDDVLGGGAQRHTCPAETLQFEGQPPVYRLDPETVNQSTFARNFKRCLRLPVSVSRFIIIILNIWNCNGGGAHANVLIYDKTNHTLERYEPNGINTSFYSSFKLDRELERAFNAMTPTDTTISELGGTFFGPHSFTDFGIQNMEGLNPRKKPSTKSWEKPESIEKGFCFFWSILYIEYKLNNPDIERKDIIPLIYKMARLSLDKKNNFQPLAIIDDDAGVVELGKTISAKIPDEFSRYYRGNYSAIKGKKIKYDFNSYIRSYALFMYIIMGYVTEIIELYGFETPEFITQKYEDGINRMLNYIKSNTGQKLIKKKKNKKKKSKPN